MRRRSGMVSPLSKDALAITLHHARLCGESLVVDTTPVQIPSSPSRVMIVSDLLGLLFLSIGSANWRVVLSVHDARLSWQLGRSVQRCCWPRLRGIA